MGDGHEYNEICAVCGRGDSFEGSAFERPDGSRQGRRSQRPGLAKRVPGPSPVLSRRALSDWVDDILREANTVVIGDQESEMLPHRASAFITEAVELATIDADKFSYERAQELLPLLDNWLVYFEVCNEDLSDDPVKAFTQLIRTAFVELVRSEADEEAHRACQATFGADHSDYDWDYQSAG